METADDAFCRALFREQRSGQFAPLGLDEAVLAALLNQQFDAQRTAYAHRFPDAGHFVIGHSGTDVGRLIVTCAPASPSDEGGGDTTLAPLTLHLVDITIASAARQRVIGSDVIESLARAGHAIGATRFTLQVLQTNVAARRLYERLGFVTVADGTYLSMQRALP